MTKKLLKGFLLCILAFFIFSATVFTTYDIIISDTISCSYDAYRASPFISISNKIDESRTNSVFRQNKVTRLKSQNSDKYKDISLYVGGMPFGVKFITEGVLVVGFSDIRKVFAEKPGEFDPRKYCGPARDLMTELYKHKIINVLGSNGKAE